MNSNKLFETLLSKKAAEFSGVAGEFCSHLPSANTVDEIDQKRALYFERLSNSAFSELTSVIC